MKRRRLIKQRRRAARRAHELVSKTKKKQAKKHWNETLFNVFTTVELMRMTMEWVNKVAPFLDDVEHQLNQLDPQEMSEKQVAKKMAHLLAQQHDGSSSSDDSSSSDEQLFQW